MPLDYTSVPPSQWSAAARFCLVALAGGVAGFVGFCAIDFIDVKLAPSFGQNFYWLLWSFPTATGFVAARVLHQFTPTRRVGLALLAAGIASVLAWVLILIPGVLFHIGIGGRWDL